MSLLDIPSYIALMYFSNRQPMGRKRTLIWCQVLAGVCCVLSTVTNFNTCKDHSKILTLSFAFLGRFFIGGAFSLVYTYSCELFSTDVRSQWDSFEKARGLEVFFYFVLFQLSFLVDEHLCVRFQNWWYTSSVYFIFTILLPVAAWSFVWFLWNQRGFVDFCFAGNYG